MTRLHSLADLSTLFGPDAKAPVIKNGASAEAARRKDQAMKAVAELVNPAKQSDAVLTGADFARKSAPTTGADWIEGQIARCQDGPVTLTIELTPEIAQALLSRNDGNRKISAAVVDKYARDIATRRFSYNGESIIVSRDGSLNDGQHRCAAVVKSGRSLRTVIVFGPERESRMTLGQGKIRLVADHIAMQGRPDSASYGAVAGYIWQFRTHKRLSQQGYLRPTRAEILSTVEGYPDIELSMGSVIRQGAHLLGGRSLLAFCHWVFARRDREAADAFMRALGTGAGLDTRHPILIARNRLMSGHRYTPNEKAEVLFRAWNACRRGESRASLQIKGGVLPAVED